MHTFPCFRRTLVKSVVELLIDADLLTFFSQDAKMFLVYSREELNKLPLDLRRSSKGTKRFKRFRKF